MPWNYMFTCKNAPLLHLPNGKNKLLMKKNLPNGKFFRILFFVVLMFSAHNPSFNAATAIFYIRQPKRLHLHATC